MGTLLLLKRFYVFGLFCIGMGVFVHTNDGTFNMATLGTSIQQTKPTISAKKTSLASLMIPKSNSNKLHTVVDFMPLFPGCEAQDNDYIAQKNCAEDKLDTYIQENLEYPRAAKRSGIEGTVVIRFVVNKQGKIEQSQILRDIGAGCGKEALRLVNEMNKLPNTWISGQHNGEIVNVQYNLNVKFQL